MDEVRVRLRRKLEEAFGVEEATFLMDRPPGGWNDLVTNQTLRLEMDALRHELRGEITELRGDVGALEHRLTAAVDRRLRAQTWMTTTAILAGTSIAAAIGRFG